MREFVFCLIEIVLGIVLGCCAIFVQDIFFYIMIGLYVPLAIIFAVLLLKDRKKKNLIKEHSEKYKQIKKLNMQYDFDYEVNGNLYFRIEKKTAKNLGMFNCEEYLRHEIITHFHMYRELIEKIDKNAKDYRSYNSKIKKLKSTNTDLNREIKLDRYSFATLENALSKKIIKKEPSIKLTACFYVNYSIMTGKIYKSEHYLLTDKEVREIFKEVKENKEG